MPTSCRAKNLIRKYFLAFNAKNNQVIVDKDNTPKFFEESIAKNYASIKLADQISDTIENNSIMLRSSFVDQYAGLYIDENNELNVAGSQTTNDSYSIKIANILAALDVSVNFVN